ncbi:ATP binding microtubule motor family protein [Rhynchospora pubera]|uniref:ATP binding microtubule motor family protein n=1 Tax=Rhynchospora pubera TaxID=906938 RepID=A0AAV8EY53_9POAL|nr:ATP binding microtubule motor family protein [Rhynchospora pubera]
MGAAAAGDDELSAAIAGKTERILVSVRVRPLNAKEIEIGDSSDWDCTNGTTIVFKHPPPGERALFPTSYTYDRVFGKDIGTRQVYELGAREVALSVVRGINSSIFAYGQTSSGKTYTMTGITEFSVADIYNYIKKHADREFTLKFSAMEIYNEAVRDLLSTDSTPLRLLDDPEKGTIVEKLIEETLRDQDHLRELLSICAAQRQIGETNLNEMSSRSHQILRLTIESSPKVYAGRDGSGALIACVNFVDLAGSERASQAMSAGVRLKEGCHINRSLLTLGTVIRKLSKGGRNGHVPYRDSKLTRILQPALGGNARTAIICTMSPAHSHVEQSRNTLLFASCAKEVVTNARVNLVMSDKALIKHLQRELSRLETELKYTGSGSGLGDCNSHSEVLKEKDAKIRKLENDLKDLMLERNLAQSRLDDLLRSARDETSSRQWDELSRTSGTHARSTSSEVFSNSDTFAPLEDREYGFTLSEAQNTADSDLEGRRRHQSSSPGMYNLGSHHSPNRDFEPLTELYEEHCKEVQCIEINNLVSRTQSDKLSILLPEDTDNLLPLTDADKLEQHEVSSSDDSELPVTVDEELKSVTTTKMVDIFAAPESRFTSTIDSVLHDDADDEDMGFSKRVHDDFAEPDLRIVHSESCTDLQNEVDLRSSSFTKRVDQHSVDPELPFDVNEEADESIVKKVDSFSKPESKVEVSKDQEPPETVQEKNDATDKALVRFAKLSSDVSPLLAPSPGSLTRSRSCRASLMLTSAYLIEDLQDRDKMTPPDTFYKDSEVRPERVRRSLYTQNSENMQDRLSIVRSHGSERFASDESEREKQVAQGQSKKQIDKARRAMSEDMLVVNNVEKEASGFDPTALGSIPGSPSRWPLEFEKKQQEIIELWHICNVSIVHRTHFFLLFNGDPADAIYMEVELRRLSFLKSNLLTGGNNTVTSSLRTLKREREMLYRQMLKKLNTQERENVYSNWGIDLSSKQRRWQLARLIWTKTETEHVRESASLVADLIGLSEPGQALKQMVELSFGVTPPRVNRLSFSLRGGSFD